MSKVKIFSGEQTRYLAEKIASAYGMKLGELIIQRFSDGEMVVFFNESVRGIDVYMIQSTFSPADNIMELLLAIDAAKRASAATVTVVIPYYGYARQDRKDKPRVSIGAKLKANLISAAGADRIVTCELHAGQIQGFFDIPVVHLQTSALFVNYVRRLNLDHVVFASPDVGGVSRVRSFAKHFEADIVICDKHRARANEVAGMQVIGNVDGRNVILLDDMIDTGGTLCKAADILMEKGAVSVRAICTHPVFSGKAYDNIENSSLIEVAVTDTIPLKKEIPKVKVLSVAELLAKAIRKIHDDESISALFMHS